MPSSEVHDEDDGSGTNTDELSERPAEEEVPTTPDEVSKEEASKVIPPVIPQVIWFEFCEELKKVELDANSKTFSDENQTWIAFKEWFEKSKSELQKDLEIYSDILRDFWWYSFNDPNIAALQEAMNELENDGTLTFATIEELKAMAIKPLNDDQVKRVGDQEAYYTYRDESSYSSSDEDSDVDSEMEDNSDSNKEELSDADKEEGEENDGGDVLDLDNESNKEELSDADKEEGEGEENDGGDVVDEDDDGALAGYETDKESHGNPGLYATFINMESRRLLHKFIDLMEEVKANEAQTWASNKDQLKHLEEKVEKMDKKPDRKNSKSSQDKMFRQSFDDKEKTKLKNELKKSKTRLKNSPWEFVIEFEKKHKQDLHRSFSEMDSFDERLESLVIILLEKRAPEHLIILILKSVLKNASFEQHWRLLRVGAKHSISPKVFDMLIGKEKENEGGRKHENKKLEECPFKVLCAVQSKQTDKDYTLIDKLIEKMKEFDGFDPFWATIFHPEINSDVIVHILTKSEDTKRDGLTRLEAALLSNRSGAVAAALLEGPGLPEISASTMDILAKKTATSPPLQEVFNSKIVERLPTAMLGIELYSTCLLVIFFVYATVEFLEQDEKDWVSLTLVLVFNSYFLFLETMQIVWNGGFFYILDAWNLFELSRIALLYLSVGYMGSTRGGPMVADHVRSTLMISGLFAFAGFILFLRSTFLPFGTFVGGLVLIFQTLIPFLVVSFLLLFTFSFMYYTRRFDSADCEAEGYCTLNGSMLTSVNGFFSGPDSTDLWMLDIAFGFVVVVVLLNVVIAIVSDAWGAGSELAGEWFWKYRIAFLADVATMKSLNKLSGFFSVAETKIRYVKFEFCETREGSSDCIQLSEIMLYDSLGGKIPLKSARNPGGNNPEQEGPHCIIENDPHSKWLDTLKQPIIIELQDSLEISDLVSYQLRTANDFEQRDPIRWKVTASASLDEAYWFSVDDRSNGNQDVPEERFKETQKFQTKKSLTTSFKIWVRGKKSKRRKNESDNAGTEKDRIAELSVDDKATEQTKIRFVKFEFCETREHWSDCIQLSEIMLYDRLGGKIPLKSARNPGGNNPEKEGPHCIIEDDRSSKWLDFEKLPIIMELQDELEISDLASYQLRTANDCEERDPTRWKVTVSASLEDEAGWCLVDDRSNGNQDIPEERLKETQKFQTSLNVEDKATEQTKPTEPELVRYLRFTPLKTRGDADCVQLSEIRFYQDFGKRIYFSSAEMPDGYSPDGEEPDRVIDGSRNTKWLSWFNYDDEEVHLILNLRTPIKPNKISSYRFRTANDCEERDPCSWRFDWSDSKSGEKYEWQLLHFQAESKETIPTKRHELSDYFHLATRPGICSFKFKILSAALFAEIDALGDRTIFDSINWTKTPYRACAHNNDLYSAYAGKNKPDPDTHYHASTVSKEEYEKLCRIASFERDWVVARRTKRQGETWKVIGRFLAYCLCLLLGLVSAGIFWPRRIREALFSFTTEVEEDAMATLTDKVTSSSRAHDDVAASLDNRISQLEAMATKNQKAMEEKLSAMEENQKAMEEKLNTILKALEGSNEESKTSAHG